MCGRTRDFRSVVRGPRGYAKWRIGDGLISPWREGDPSRQNYTVIALGHAVVEIPLIVLLVVGVGRFLASTAARAGIGLADRWSVPPCCWASA